MNWLNGSIESAFSHFCRRGQSGGHAGQGIEVISFAQGEPDFDTPANIKEAAYKANRRGHYQIHTGRRL